MAKIRKPTKSRAPVKKQFCANPMQVRVCCTECHWSEQYKPYHGTTGKWSRECPSCKAKTKLIME